MRGNRSLKADNNPLVLVDGIDYGSFVDINPTDIESIEVLKDISSTAIYGTKGANGVIIITTKSGAKGQKTKIDFNAYVSIKNKAKYPRMMNGEEYAQLKREAYRTTNSAAPDQYMDDALIFNAEELEYLEKGYWVDWQDLLLGTGITQNYEISMSGGTEKTSYSLSFGFQDDKGLLKNDVLKRYNGRISLDHKINKIFNVGVNVSYTFKDQDKRQNPLNLANKVTTKKRNAERYSDRIELQGFQSCFRLFVKPSQSPLKPNQDAATLLVRNHARNGDKRTRITKQGVKD